MTGHCALRALLPARAVRLGARAADWRDAVRQSGLLLVDTGATTSDYVDQMVAAVERYGPYIAIAPGFALAHAQASGAVLHTGLSWLGLAEGVRFGHAKNDPVTVVMGLAGRDHTEHLAALQEVAALVSDHDLWARARACTDASALLALLDQPTGGES